MAKPRIRKISPFSPLFPERLLRVLSAAVREAIAEHIKQGRGEYVAAAISTKKPANKRK